MSNETAGEARLMEPVYRMIKIVQNEDDNDAKIVASLAVQYLTDNYKDALSRQNIQDTLRKVLVYYKNGYYYSQYLKNELQVFIAQYLTILAADLPVKIGEIGDLAERFDAWLKDKDALRLKSAEVLEWFLNECAFEAELHRRAMLNKKYYLKELTELIGQ